MPFHSIFNKYLIQENNPNYLDHINHFVLLEHFNDKIYLSIAEKGIAYAKESTQFAFKLNSNITESKENELLRHIDYFLKSLYLESKQCTFFIGNELAVHATFVSNFARIQPTIKLHLLAVTQINKIGEMARAYVITELINSLPGSRKREPITAPEIRLNTDLFTENATVYKLGKNGTPIGIVSIEDYLSEVSLLTRQMAFEVKDIVKNSDGKIIEFSIIEY